MNSKRITRRKRIVTMNTTINKVLKSHMVLAVLSVFAVVLMAGGVSYSLFQVDKRNTTNQTVAVGTLDANITSIEGGIVVSDLYPESASTIGDDHKKYNFTISNTGTYDIEYTIYLKDATDELIASTNEYANYKRISNEHYQYINYKLDGNAVSNLTKKQTGEKFIIMKGFLKAGASEDHSIQFFLDNQDTTTTGAPNEIAGSILSLNIYFEGGVGEETIVDKIIAASNGVRTAFDDPATTDEGVFEMEDDYGTSYYYRGAVENNYVKFAGFYWRIIRVNGDGSLRIIYDGAQAYANGTDNEDRFIKTGQAYNTNYNDAKYVGWMYGPVGTTASTSKEEAQTNTVNSTIKGIVDEWYKTNIEEVGYGDVISDTLFCNDRSTPGKEITGWANDTGLGYGTNYTGYGATARTRVWNNKESAPTFKCLQKNDAFTVNDTNKGNGALTYPVGLITADEIVAAGSGKYKTTNTNYYLYRGSSYWYWSISPCNFYSDYAGVFIVRTSGNLINSSVYTAGGAAAPVINLSAKYVRTLRGTGTMTDPYQI